MHAEHGWHVRVSHALRAVPPHFDAGVLTALSVNRGMPGNQNLDSQAVDFNEMMQLFQMLQQKGGPVPAGNPLAHMHITGNFGRGVSVRTVPCLVFRPGWGTNRCPCEAICLCFI